MKTKELIFNAALRLFALHGYDGTSIRAICKAVGISESSLYNHYAGKKELLSAILSRYNEIFEQVNPSVAEREHLADTLSLGEVLFYLIDRFIALTDNPEDLQIWQVLSSEQYKNREAGMIIITETTRRIERLTAIFDRMQKNNKMLPCNSKQVATSYIFSIRAQHLSYILSRLYLPDSKRNIDDIHKTAELIADLYGIK